MGGKINILGSAGGVGLIEFFSGRGGRLIFEGKGGEKRGLLESVPEGKKDKVLERHVLHSLEEEKAPRKREEEGKRVLSS